MKCPSCGFENIPGRTECGVCAASLVAADGSLSVYPLRARDRTLRRRWDWFWRRHLEDSPVGAAKRRARTAVASVRAAYRPGFGPVEAAVVVASVAPGLGYRLVRRDTRSANRHLLSAIGMLLLAALLYRTPVADILALGVVALSMLSVVVAVEGQRPPAFPGQERFRAQITLLMTFAAYVGFAFFTIILLQPRWMIGTVTQSTSAAAIRRNDRVLFTNGLNIQRGEVVMGMGDQDRRMRLGPLVGLPGETLTVVQDGRVYVDSRLTTVRLEPFFGSGVGQVVLGDGEVWVPPVLLVEGEAEALGTMIVSAGITSRSSLRRAVAVVGPPGHRGPVRRESVFVEGSNR